MNETAISWTELTWNPMSGCRVVSTECKHCYAETLAEQKRGTRAFPVGFDLTMRPHKLREPSKIKAPSLIFCNSMSDFGLEELPDSYRDQILDAIEETPRHRYQVLTKRPQVVREYLARRGRRMPDSVWMGVTVGHVSTIARIDELRRIDARVHFVSAEPLLSALPISLDGIDWIITGGESGNHWRLPGALETRFLVRPGLAGEARWMPREDRADWIRRLDAEAAMAGAAHWFKQWGGPRPDSGGRMLDGSTRDGMPSHVPGAMPETYDHRERSKAHREPSYRLPLVS